MRRTLPTLFLLSTFLLGWVVGPRLTCRKVMAGEPSSGHASCHGMASVEGASTMRYARSLEEQGCCDIACQHACHMVAVLSVEPIVLTVAPLSQRPVERVKQSVPAVTFRIDHVPLA